MVYPFQCPKCNTYIETIRPHTEASIPEECKCGEIMDRVWTAPQLIPVQIEPFFSPAHDQYIRNKNDLKEAGKRYTDRTGSEIIEVGNETKYLKRTPKKQSYDLPAEVLSQLEA